MSISDSNVKTDKALEMSVRPKGSSKGTDNRIFASFSWRSRNSAFGIIVKNMQIICSLFGTLSGGLPSCWPSSGP